MDDLLKRAHDLAARGQPCALATVVRVERPASARPGMKAIIYADGTLEGWVGGACAHPVVVREALRLLREGTPALIGLHPPDAMGAHRPGVIYHPMTCHSGGSLEVYIEPMLPTPDLLVIGDAPVVEALVDLGRLQGFAVSVAGTGGGGPTRQGDAGGRLSLRQLRDRITPRTYVVVATMGAYDEEALEEVVGAGAAYLGLVASRKRAEAVFAYLREKGIAADPVQRIKVPAGLDIGAVTPEEIALSIIAEIVQVRRRTPTPGALPATLPDAAAADLPAEVVAIDSICGMEVEIAGARHVVDYQGRRFYFCSASCRQTFEREPARYATSVT